MKSAEARPSEDLSRAVHLAMVGRFDEAWTLAQARPTTCTK
jgi:hypothetical protein